ncbi:MAG: hypothetical protein LBV74_22830 [Tannerella sp.]|jgi:hypothetical protein|nr:hypothetical protein [Tannerella sp.]
MKTKENRGASSASPLSDVLKTLPCGAEVLAASGSRSKNYEKIELVYSVNDSITHLSLTKEGGQS